MIHTSLRSPSPFTVLNASKRWMRVAVAVVACLGWSAAAHAVTAPTIANNILPTVSVGSSETQTVSLTLTSAEAISSIAFQSGSSSEFSIVSTSGCTLDGTTIEAIGTVCNVVVSFAPARPGSTVSPGLARNATLLFTDSAANVFAYGVSGAATGPIDHVTPGTVTDFAGVPFTGSNVSTLDNGLGLVNAASGGDGGAATSAHFGFWAGVIVATSVNGSQPMALDSAGNLYVIDAGNYVIRKIAAGSPNTVTTIAGIAGSAGSTGNGGLATSAKLNTPSAIALDSAGNIYFLDTQGSNYGIIRRIDAVTGIITGVAGQNFNGTYNAASGGGTCGYTQLYSELAHECGDGGLASYAWLNGVHSMAIDGAGNIYLWGSVTGYADLRKITAATGVITTVANTTAFNTTYAAGGMTLAADGNIYVVVTNSAGTEDIIEKFNTGTNAITIVGGGAQPIGANCVPATAQRGFPVTNLAIFQPPDGESVDLSSDASGNIYYSGGLCNQAGDNANITPAVFRINTSTNYAYLELNGYGDFSGATATSNYDAYYNYAIYPVSAIPDNNGNIYFTTFNQIGLLSGSSAALNYPSQNDFTTSATQIASFANVGNAAAVTPTYVFASGTNYVLTSTGDTNACSAQANIASGAVCNLDIGFAPVAVGTLSDTLNVTSSGTQTSVALTGLGVAEPQFAITPSNLAFGNQTGATTSSTQTFTLSNPGTASLTVSSLFLDGAGASKFTIASGGTCPTAPSSFMIAAGSSCTLNIAFTPPAVVTSTAYSASLYVADSINFGDTSTITGTGVPAGGPPSAIAPLPLVFSPAQVGVSLGSAQTLTATFQVNGFAAGFTPTAALHYGLSYKIGAVTCTGPAGTLSCSVPVTFQPQYPGGRREALFLMNGSTRIASVLIYGVGQSPFALLQPGIITQPILNYSPSYNYASVVDENGTVYVIQRQTNDIAAVTKAGVVTTLPITGLSSPREVAIDGAGVLYIADQRAFGPLITYDTVQGVLGTVPYPAGPFYIQGLAVGNTGNLYETDDQNVYTIPISGTGTAATVAINPSVNQAYILTTDSNEDIFVGGYSINEIAAGGTQTQVSATAVDSGLSTDAAETLYATRYTGYGGVAELPATGYGTPLGTVDTAASPLGDSVGPDGTVYVGNYNNLDKVDRSQGVIAFGSVGATASKTVGIYNGGNQPLILTNIATAGAGFSWAAASTNPCALNTPIPAGATCQVTVTLTASHAGFYSGTLTYTDNSLNSGTSTQTVALSGEEYGIYVVPSPTSLNFGNVAIGSTSAAQTITLTNYGDSYSATINAVGGTGPFTFAPGTCTSPLAPATSASAPGGSCQLSVTFTPTTTAVFSNTQYGITASSSGIPSVAFFVGVSGTGTSGTTTTAMLSPNYFVFPNTQAGSTSAAMQATLTNTGTAPLTGIVLSLSGGFANQFAISSTTCGTTLAASASCFIYVTFTPGSANSYSAALSVADNATVAPQTLALSGAGIGGTPSITLSPTSLNFPSTTVGVAATSLPITLSNPGTVALAITSISVGGANASSFGETNTCGSSVAAGGSCTITVSFTPASAGALGASISVVDSATGSPHTVALTGTGAAVLVPQAVLSPTSLTFPSTTVGVAATALPVTLSNPGTGALAITSVSVSGANASSFGETNTCGSSLAAGGSCTITVSFTPGSAGALGASISVVDNASGSPQAAGITGTGVAVVSGPATFTVSSSTPSASVQAGGVAQFNLVIAPVGGSFTNVVTLSATGLPAGAQASFLPPAVTPGAAGAPSVLSIQTATGAMARLSPPERRGPSSVPLLALLAGLPLLGFAASTRRLRKSAGRWMLLGFALLSVLPLLALSGCGGGYFGRAPQTYTVTVVGTSGALQQSTTISLTVQ